MKHQLNDWRLGANRQPFLINYLVSFAGAAYGRISLGPPGRSHILMLAFLLAPPLAFVAYADDCLQRQQCYAGCSSDCIGVNGKPNPACITACMNVCAKQFPCSTPAVWPPPHFLPSRNGLHYSNATWPDVPDYTLDILGYTIPIGNAAGGLCGGMVFGVLDLFEARLLPPATKTNPDSGSPAFNYIAARLTNSFNLDNASAFVSWILMPDHDTVLSHGLAWHEINEEWHKIKADLDQNLPSTLGLVHGQESLIGGLNNVIQDLQHCHQVLAYGYDLHGTLLTIYIYDPNVPDSDNQTIMLDTLNPISTFNVTGYTQGYFRGFFQTHYSFHDPSTQASGSFGLTVVTSPGFLPNGGPF